MFFHHTIRFIPSHARILCLFLCVLFVPADIYAATLILKTGRKINALYVEEKDTFYMCYFKSGMMVGFRKDGVDRVVDNVKIDIPNRGRSAKPYVFDVWMSGTTVQDTFQTARANDIPLVSRGIQTPGSGYNPNYAEPFARTSRSYFYWTTFFGAKCSVELQFTPKDALLYQTAIYWENIELESGVFLEVKKMLDEKYNDPFSEETTEYGQRFVWRPNDNVEIELTSSPRRMNLRYTDKKMSLTKDQDEEALRLERRRKYDPRQDKEKL